MKKTILTFFAVISMGIILAQPVGFGPMGGPMMGGPMMGETSIDVSSVTRAQVAVMKGNLGLDAKQEKKITKIAQKENENVANVIISARSNRRSGTGGPGPDGGPMGGPMGGPRPEGVGPQNGPQTDAAQANGNTGLHRRGIDLSDESTQRELDKIYSQSEKKILDVLTENQKEIWRSQAAMNIDERNNRVDQIVALIMGGSSRGNR